MASPCAGDERLHVGGLAVDAVGRRPRSTYRPEVRTVLDVVWGPRAVFGPSRRMNVCASGPAVRRPRSRPFTTCWCVLLNTLADRVRRDQRGASLGLIAPARSLPTSCELRPVVLRSATMAPTPARSDARKVRMVTLSGTGDVARREAWLGRGVVGEVLMRPHQAVGRGITGLQPSFRPFRRRRATTRHPMTDGALDNEVRQQPRDPSSRAFRPRQAPSRSRCGKPLSRCVDDRVSTQPNTS